MEENIILENKDEKNTVLQSNDVKDPQKEVLDKKLSKVLLIVALIAFVMPFFDLFDLFIRNELFSTYSGIQLLKGWGVGVAIAIFLVFVSPVVVIFGQYLNVTKVYNKLLLLLSTLVSMLSIVYITYRFYSIGDFDFSSMYVNMKLPLLVYIGCALSFVVLPIVKGVKFSKIISELQAEKKLSYNDDEFFDASLDKVLLLCALFGFVSVFISAFDAVVGDTIVTDYSLYKNIAEKTALISLCGIISTITPLFVLATHFIKTPKIYRKIILCISSILGLVSAIGVIYLYYKLLDFDLSLATMTLKVAFYVNLATCAGYVFFPIRSGEKFNYKDMLITLKKLSTNGSCSVDLENECLSDIDL